jgi:hypothetical protein
LQVLSTTNNDSWRDQRDHFIEAFLPHHSLAKLFPINLARSLKVRFLLDGLQKSCFHP